ncbi:MAG: hypothetical protein PHG24_00175 [Candidatus Pacebacteria bacterium]|nr:hypothetical protein [Candidatus Paceibacterota bacterium]
MKKNIILSLLILVFGAICFYSGISLNTLKVNDGYFLEQGYSFKTPVWAQTDELGVTAFLNEEEDNGENPFKSYVFIVKDKLEGRSFEQYIEYIKTQVQNSSQSMEVIEEKDDGNSHVVFVKTTQDDVNYIIGMSFVKGLSDTCFIVSLNTIESSFELTKPVFEETYRSFTLR